MRSTSAIDSQLFQSQNISICILISFEKLRIRVSSQINADEIFISHFRKTNSTRFFSLCFLKGWFFPFNVDLHPFYKPLNVKSIIISFKKFFWKIFISKKYFLVKIRSLNVFLGVRFGWRSCQTFFLDYWNQFWFKSAQL